MRKSKKVLALLLASTMVLSMTACGGGGSVTSNQDPVKSSSPANSSTPASGTPGQTAAPTGSEADTQIGVEQTAEQGAPPADAPVGGQFIVQIGPGTLSPDMMGGWAANASNTGFIRLMEGYLTISKNREGLLDWDPIPVKSHEEKVNDDKSHTYTVTINDNLKWSDGSKITAKDYVFYILFASSKNFKELEADATVGSMLVGFEDFNSGKTKEFSGVHLIDEYTFSFTVKAEEYPNYYILEAIGTRPEPMAAIAPGADIKDDGKGCYFTDEYTTETLRKTLLDPKTGFRYKRPVVCGPYKLKNVDISTETVELEINPEYLGLRDGTKPHVQSIISKPIAPETWRDEFAKGTVDMFTASKGEPIDTTLTKVESGEIKANYGIVPSNAVNDWRFACDLGPSQFSEVRRAFAYIIDRDEMNKQLNGGYPTVVDCLATLAMKDYQDTKDELEGALTHYSYDLEKAKKELVDGGWTLNKSGGEFKEGTDKIRYKKVGEELMPLVLNWAYSESEANTLYNTVIPPEAAKIGMELKGTKMDFSQIINHLNREGVDATYNVFSVGVVLPEFSAWWYFFDDAPERMGLWNYYRVSDPELKSITQSMRAVEPGDTETYQKLFVDFQKEINKKLPGVVMNTATEYWFYNPKLKNYVPRAHDGWWSAILDAYIVE